MTDYFYTSSLIYAAAAIEQGFEGVQTYDKNCVTGKMQWSNVLDLNTEYEQWRFPKTPHNVALMELIEDDLFLYVTEGNQTYSYMYKNNYPCPDYSKTIIYRNNKPFPVWDKEGV